MFKLDAVSALAIIEEEDALATLRQHGITEILAKIDDIDEIEDEEGAFNALMEAMYGVNGIKDGHLDGVPLESVYQACLSLQGQGATVIVPGMTELSLVCGDLQRRGISVLDINQIYAEFATQAAAAASVVKDKVTDAASTATDKVRRETSIQPAP